MPNNNILKIKAISIFLQKKNMAHIKKFNHI